MSSVGSSPINLGAPRRSTRVGNTDRALEDAAGMGLEVERTSITIYHRPSMTTPAALFNAFEQATAAQGDLAQLDVHWDRLEPWDGIWGSQHSDRQYNSEQLIRAAFSFIQDAPSYTESHPVLLWTIKILTTTWPADFGDRRRLTSKQLRKIWKDKVAHPIKDMYDELQSLTQESATNMKDAVTSHPTSPVSGDTGMTRAAELAAGVDARLLIKRLTEAWSGGLETTMGLMETLHRTTHEALREFTAAEEKLNASWRAFRGSLNRPYVAHDLVSFCVDEIKSDLPLTQDWDMLDLDHDVIRWSLFHLVKGGVTLPSDFGMMRWSDMGDPYVLIVCDMWRETVCLPLLDHLSTTWDCLTIDSSRLRRLQLADLMERTQAQQFGRSVENRRQAVRLHMDVKRLEAQWALFQKADEPGNERVLLDFKRKEIYPVRGRYDGMLDEEWRPLKDAHLKKEGTFSLGLLRQFLQGVVDRTPALDGTEIAIWTLWRLILDVNFDYRCAEVIQRGTESIPEYRDLWEEEIYGPLLLSLRRRTNSASETSTKNTASVAPTDKAASDVAGAMPETPGATAPPRGETASREKTTSGLKKPGYRTDSLQGLAAPPERKKASRPAATSGHGLTSPTKSDPRLDSLQGLRPARQKKEALSRPLQADQGNKEPAAVIPVPVLYFDGASRNNPGTAGAGAVLYGSDGGEELWAGHEFVGVAATNNQAEYHALILGLQAANDRKIGELIIRGDSELVIKQMKGINQIKATGLRPLYEQAKRLCESIPKLSFQHVRRELNQRADGLANEAVDVYKAGQSVQATSAPGTKDGRSTDHNVVGSRCNPGPIPDTTRLNEIYGNLRAQHVDRTDLASSDWELVVDTVFQLLIGRSMKETSTVLDDADGPVASWIQSKIQETLGTRGAHLKEHIRVYMRLSERLHRHHYVQCREHELATLRLTQKHDERLMGMQQRHEKEMLDLRHAHDEQMLDMQRCHEADMLLDMQRHHKADNPMASPAVRAGVQQQQPRRKQNTAHKPSQKTAHKPSQKQQHGNEHAAGARRDSKAQRGAMAPRHNQEQRKPRADRRPCQREQDAAGVPLEPKHRRQLFGRIVGGGFSHSQRPLDMLRQRWKMDELDSFRFECILHRGGKTGAFVLTFPTRAEACAFWRYKCRHFGIGGRGGPNREVMIMGKRPSREYRDLGRRPMDAEVFDERDPFGFKAGQRKRMPASFALPQRRSVVEVPADM